MSGTSGSLQFEFAVCSYPSYKRLVLYLSSRDIIRPFPPKNLYNYEKEIKNLPSSTSSSEEHNFGQNKFGYRKGGGLCRVFLHHGVALNERIHEVGAVLMQLRLDKELHQVPENNLKYVGISHLFMQSNHGLNGTVH
jgi:hypothetical protein